MQSTFELVESSDPSDPDLITLEALKLELGITTTTDDAQLQARITRESELIAEACNRRLAFADAIETFIFEMCEVALPRFALPLSLYPVDAIDTITVDGSELATTDYRINAESGLVWRVGGSWSGTIVVTYSGGYHLPDDAPGALQTALIQAVVDRRASLSVSAEAGIREITHGDEHIGFFPSQTVTSGSLSAPVRDLISGFRRPSFA